MLNSHTPPPKKKSILRQINYCRVTKGCHFSCFSDRLNSLAYRLKKIIFYSSSLKRIVCFFLLTEYFFMPKVNIAEHFWPVNFYFVFVHL